MHHIDDYRYSLTLWRIRLFFSTSFADLESLVHIIQCDYLCLVCNHNTGKKRNKMIKHDGQFLVFHICLCVKWCNYFLIRGSLYWTLSTLIFNSEELLATFGNICIHLQCRFYTQRYYDANTFIKTIVLWWNIWMFSFWFDILTYLLL